MNKMMLAIAALVAIAGSPALAADLPPAQPVGQ
jgi:hypothetical protein